MNYRNLLLSIVVLSFLLSCSKDKTTEPTTTNSTTVTICSQVWMVKNLDVDHYRNGDPIPQVTDSLQWATLTTGAWCYYNNYTAMGAIYGKLYNWFAVHDPRGLAPLGFHVPTDNEWKTLEICLGMSQAEADEMKQDGRGTIEGGKLKEAGTSHWISPNVGATNESGFSALPTGSRSSLGEFYGNGSQGVWWSSSISNGTDGWGRGLFFLQSNIFRGYFSLEDGNAVRCVRD